MSNDDDLKEAKERAVAAKRVWDEASNALRVIEADREREREHYYANAELGQAADVRALTKIARKP